MKWNQINRTIQWCPWPRKHTVLFDLVAGLTSTPVPSPYSMFQASFIHRDETLCKGARRDTVFFFSHTHNPNGASGTVSVWLESAHRVQSRS